MTEWERVVKGLRCIAGDVVWCAHCPYSDVNGSGRGDRCKRDCAKDALALLKAQEPRVMNVAEVTALEAGTVLWVEEHQGVTWNLFPLEIDVSSIHPDTGTNYLFFITYHGCKKFECEEYNRTWRCWTKRPTDEQRKATPWES